MVNTGDKTKNNFEKSLFECKGFFFFVFFYLTLKLKNKK